VGRHEFGSHGVISVSSNIIPGLMRQLMDNDNIAQTTLLNQQLQSLMSWLFCEPNPIAINTALMMTNAVAKNFRLPYQALTLEQRQQGFDLLKALAPDDIVGNELMLLSDDDFHYCV
jgi:4-hydroxy-tetrahydrodipicolinate synthase